MAIARVWHGVVPRSKRAKYLEYLKTTGMRDYSRTPGNMGASILVRSEGNTTEFIIVSYWKSMKAIRTFAGKDAEKARYYPEDNHYLLELEPKVKHYRIALGPSRTITVGADDGVPHR